MDLLNMTNSFQILEFYKNVKVEDTFLSFKPGFLKFRDLSGE